MANDNKQQKNQAQTEVAPKSAPVSTPVGAAGTAPTEVKTGPVESQGELAGEIMRLREENEALYEETELIRLQAEQKRLLELKASAKTAEPSFINAKGQLVAERFRGTKSYTLKQPHYRQGDYMPIGTKITVTDEKPSRTWEAVKPRVAAAPVVETEKVVERPSDISV